MSGTINEDEVNNVFKQLNDTQGAASSIDIGYLLRQVLRYKWLIVALTLASVMVTYAFSSLIRPIYQAATVFQVIEYNDSDVVGAGANRRVSNFRNTQLTLLRSKRVAARVVDELSLYKNPEFTGELRQRTIASVLRSGVRRGLRLVGLQNNAAPDNALEQPVRQIDKSGVIGMLQSKVVVNLDFRTDLIKVTVKSFNPRVAAEIANEYVNVYRDIDREDKEAEKERRNNTLSEALGDIEGRIGKQEKRLATFIRTNNAIDLDDGQNLETQRLKLLNSQYLKAQSERISLESRYKFGSVDNWTNTTNNATVSDGDAEGDGDSANTNAASQADRGFNDGLGDINQQRVNLLTEIRQLSEIYKEDHPVLKQKKNQLADLEISKKLIVEERKKALYRQYLAAKDKEATLREALDIQKDALLTIQENSLDLNILKRELSGLKQLHAGMLERVKRSGVASELQLTQVSVVDEARPNYSAISPVISQNVGIAGGVGLMLAIGIVGLLTFSDRKLRTPDALAEICPYRNLSVVTKLDAKDLEKSPAQVELISIADPSSSFAESFRSLRTSLMYSLPGGLPKALMITSATPGEAKTTTIVNLAFTLQRNEGKKILLLDLDLRKPRLHKVFGLPVEPGVTNYLIDPDREPVIHDVNQLPSVAKFQEAASASLKAAQGRKSGLYLMSAGALTSSPVELLESEQFKTFFEKLKAEFDVILIDSAPVMGLSDALILSNYAEAVILAVSAEAATRDSVRDTVKKLESVNARVVGTVMTKFDSQSEGYQYNSKYNAYYYDYGKG